MSNNDLTRYMLRSEKREYDFLRACDKASRRKKIKEGTKNLSLILVGTAIATALLWAPPLINKVKENKMRPIYEIQSKFEESIMQGLYEIFMESLVREYTGNLSKI